MQRRATDPSDRLRAVHACFEALLAASEGGNAGEALGPTIAERFSPEIIEEARAMLALHGELEARSPTERPDATPRRGHREDGDADDRQPATLAPGARVGPFTVDAYLGSGSAGEVYRATEDAPSREVALKILWDAVSPQAASREAALLAGLEHPSIARLYRMGEFHDGRRTRAYLAMEFVRGDLTLARWAETRRDTTQCVRMAIAIADAVAFAHGRGVIHRDLKPQNILVDPDGRPVLIDFGIARLAEADATRTISLLGPRVTGTLAYAAPESLTPGAQADVRSDIFALGAILFELLAGRPFRDFTATGLAQMVVEAATLEPTRLADVDRRFRGDLDRVVARATARNPIERYASATQFADDLRRHLAGEPVMAELQPPRERLVRFVRRHRRAAALVAMSAALLVGTTAISLDFARDAREKARIAHLSAASRALDDADLMLVAQHARALGAEDGTLERDVLARAETLRGGFVTKGDWYAVVRGPDPNRVYAFGYEVAYASRPKVAAFARTETADGGSIWRKEWTFPSLDTATNCIALSPDGTRIAAFDLDGALAILDARDGRRLGHDAEDDPEKRKSPFGYAITIATDGTVAVARGALDLYRLDEPTRSIAHLDPAIGPIRAVAFSPKDPALLVAAGNAGAVLLRRLGTTLEIVTRFELPNAFQSAATWTPDGRFIAIAGRDRVLRLFDPQQAAPRWNAYGHRDSVWSLAIDSSGDETRILSAGADGTMRAWRVADGAPIAALPLSDEIVWAIAPADDGTIFTASQGGLSLSVPGRIAAWTGRGPAEPLARTGRALRIEPGARARLVEIESGRERPLPELPGAGAVSRVAISPDDARVLVLREDGTISLVDVESSTVRWSTTALRCEDVHEPNGIPSLALDAVDARAIVASRTFGCTALSAHDGAILWKKHVGASCTDVAVSHDGARIFAADRDGLVESLDARDGASIASSRRQRTRTSCMTVSADGSRLMTGGTDGTLRILDARTLEEQLNILLSPEQLRSAWIAPDGIHAVDRAGVERVR